MRANQLRLWFASMAYVLITALRRIGLKHQFAQATCGTIRLKLLKIGALVTISVRRIKIAMASGCPYATSSGSPMPSWPAPCADEPDSAQSTSTRRRPPGRSGDQTRPKSAGGKTNGPSAQKYPHHQPLARIKPRRCERSGLALQVQEALGRDPHAGDLYVFRGARGDLIKIL